MIADWPSFQLSPFRRFQTGSLLLDGPDGCGAIEAFVRINRIAEGNLLRIDLIGPDLEIGEPALAMSITR